MRWNFLVMMAFYLVKGMIVFSLTRSVSYVSCIIILLIRLFLMGTLAFIVHRLSSFFTYSNSYIRKCLYVILYIHFNLIHLELYLVSSKYTSEIDVIN